MSEITFRRPFDVSQETFDRVCEGFFRYGLYQVTEDFWQACEIVIEAAYEFSDLHLLSYFRGSHSGIKLSDIFSDGIKVSKKVVAQPKLIPTVPMLLEKSDLDFDENVHYCKENAFWLYSNCANTACQHFSPHCDYNCGDSDDEHTSYPAIAYRLGITPEEVYADYQSAVRKLHGKSFQVMELVPAKYDFISVPNVCSYCCTEHEESDLAKVRDLNICSECISNNTSQLIAIEFRFKTDLKTVLTAAGKSFPNLHQQALFLDVSSANLNTLYMLAGIYKRLVTHVSRYFDVLALRNVALDTSGLKYLAAEFFATNNIEPVDAKLKNKVESIYNLCADIGVDIPRLV